MLSVAILIRIFMGRPVLFRQGRIGMNGKLFTFLKFRSMVLDQDVVLRRNRVSKAPKGMLLKLKDDPRVTPLGRDIAAYKHR